MASKLNGYKVAVLAVDGFEQAELVEPNARSRKQAFVKAADSAKKPAAVVCHGTWLPVSAGIIKGRTVTSWPSLQDDIRNAGGTSVDKKVVEDGYLISSRKPDDLPAFNRTLIAQPATRKAA